MVLEMTEYSSVYLSLNMIFLLPKRNKFFWTIYYTPGENQAIRTYNKTENGMEKVYFGIISTYFLLYAFNIHVFFCASNIFSIYSLLNTFFPNISVYLLFFPFTKMEKINR